MQHSSRAEPILLLPFLDLHARSPRHNGAGSAIARRDTGSRNKAIAARDCRDPLRVAAPPTAKASSVPGGQRRSRPLPCGAAGSGSTARGSAEPHPLRIPTCRAGKVPPPPKKLSTAATGLPCREGPAPYPSYPVPYPFPAPAGPAAHLVGRAAAGRAPRSQWPRQGGRGAGRRRADNRGGVGSGAGRGEPGSESRAAPCGGRKVSAAAPGKGISSLVLQPGSLRRGWADGCVLLQSFS